MPKYDQLSNQLRVRILHGDYAMRSLPPERQLAVEHGVSYMTARRALQHLIDDGVLKRAANGRVEVDTTSTTGSVTPVFALLSPAFSSSGFDLWRQLLSQSVEALGGRLRQELYTHWDDPVFAESRAGFQGVFLLPSSEKMPAALIQQLAHSERPLVVLDDDLSEQGIPSLRRLSPLFVHNLLDHLQALGCRRINCLNVQPLHSVVEQHIAQWQQWMNSHSLAGDLINHPVKPYEQALSRGYEVIKSLLAPGDFQADALFCVTAPSAIGAMRAMHEAGIRPGHDVAVCTTDGEGIAQFQMPSLTALELNDPTAYIKNCIQWMLKGSGPWDGPLLMEPTTAKLQIRESTAFFDGKLHPSQTRPKQTQQKPEDNFASHNQ